MIAQKSLRKRYKWKVAVLCFALFTFMGAMLLPANAQQAEKQTVRVGYYPIAEYQDKDEAGNYFGFGYDYYLQIQKYTGWQYDFVEATYADCMKLLAAGEIDVMSGIIPTDARRETMDFSKYSISNTQSKLYARVDDNIFYESYDKFDGATVGVMRGGLTDGLEEYAREHDITFTLQTYDTPAQMEEALLQGDIRLLYATSIAEAAKTKIVARFDKTALYYAVSKSAPQISKSLNDALQKIIDNNPNFYTQMSEKYMVSGANAIATFTEEEYNYIHSGQPVYVIMNPSWAPICWYEPSTDSYVGIVPSVLEKIGQYSGLSFIYCTEAEFNEKAAQNPELINDVLAILTDDTAWAVQKNVLMTNRILDSTVVTVSKRRINQAAEGSTLRFALPKDYYISWQAAKSIPAENITYYGTVQDCLDAVNSGKADATYANELSASYFLSMLQYSDLFASVSSDWDENLAFALNRDTDEPLLGIMDKSLLCISSDEMNKIIVENSIATQRVTLQGLFYANPQIFVLIVIIVMLLICVAVVGVTILISKRKRLSARLAAEQASAAARTEFFMMISHELRTPLNAIVGYLNMAAELCRKGSPESDYVSRSQSAARQLTAVAEDMLDYTRIASATAEIHPSLFDVKNIVYHIAENASLDADKHDVNFRFLAQEINYEFVIGDELRVAQIMQNVLSNSVKFTAAGGSVEAQVTEKLMPDGKIEFCFTAKDTGKGMGPEFLQKVCAPFNQGDASYSRTHGGLGLGLYLTKYYLDAMGGHMEVESELGKGSCFTIYIPLEKASSEQILKENVDYSNIRVLIAGPDGEENAALRGLLKRLKMKCDVVQSAPLVARRLRGRAGTEYAYALCVLDESFADEAGELLTQIAETEPSPTVFIMSNGVKKPAVPPLESLTCKILSKPIFQSVLFDAVVTNFGAYKPEQRQELADFTGLRIMVVEDNNVNADILVRLLSKMNAKATICENGRKAVEEYTQNPADYDLILMDIQMPVMNGYEAAKQIRASGATVPIIAVSANAFPSDIENSLKAGMNAHLSKPVDVHRLSSTISQYTVKQAKD